MWRTLGGTDLRIKAIGLGAMPLSLADRPDEAQAFEVISAFLARGGNFIDTANVYCLDDTDLGHNERLIAQALRRLGRTDEDVVVATKGGLRRPRGAWTVDGSPAWLRVSCERSLRDLGTDCITLYQLHAVDPAIGLSASVEELVRLRDEGKIRYIGLSNVSLQQLSSALELTPITTVQNRCNPFEQQDFRNGLIDFCGRQGITYIAHSPMGGHHGHLRLQRHPSFLALAGELGVSPYALALAWLLARGPHILPIPGASKVASIADSLTALELDLNTEVIAAIDRLPDAA